MERISQITWIIIHQYSCNSLYKIGDFGGIPHSYQLKKYIRDFQREIPFPEPQRGEMFIEIATQKTQSSRGAT